MPNKPPKLSAKEWRDKNIKAGYKEVQGPRPTPYSEFYDPNKWYQKIDEKGNVVDLPYISYTIPAGPSATSDKKAIDFQYPNYTGYKLKDGSIKYYHNTTGEEMPGIVESYKHGGKVKGYANGGSPTYLEGNNTVNNLVSNRTPGSYQSTTKNKKPVNPAIAAGSGAALTVGNNLYKDPNASPEKTGVDNIATTATPWYGYAKGLSNTGKSFIKRDQFGNPINDTGEVANDWLTPDHELIMDGYKQDGWKGALRESSGAGKILRGAANLTNNDEVTKGFWGYLNKQSGLTERNQVAKDQMNNLLDAQAAEEKARIDAEEADKTAQREARIDDAISKRNLGLNKGGEVKGPGTSTSDSIKTTVEEGSFVVPAKNLDKAKMLAKKVLAPKKIPVRLSDGEYVFTPEQVHELTEAGIDLNKLAPEAKDKLINHLKCGGMVKGYAKGGNVDYTAAIDYGLPLIQAGIGLNKLNKLGKRPIDSLDEEQLGSISAARNNLNLATSNSKFGYTPEELAYLENKNNNLTAGQRFNARALSGGSSSAALNNERIALIDSFNRDLQSRIGNRQLQLEKQDKIADRQAYLDQLLARKREDKRRLYLDKLNAWNADEMAAGDLLGAGVNNLVGANRYRKELEASKQRNQRYNF